MYSLNELSWMPIKPCKDNVVMGVQIYIPWAIYQLIPNEERVHVTDCPSSLPYSLSPPTHSGSSLRVLSTCTTAQWWQSQRAPLRTTMLSLSLQTFRPECQEEGSPSPYMTATTVLWCREHSTTPFRAAPSQTTMLVRLYLLRTHFLYWRVVILMVVVEG